jgi:hypothetical protein
LIALDAGIARAWAWWQGLMVEGDNSAQLWLLLGFFLVVTLLAYLLQTFTRTIVRFYEGYALWPASLRDRRARRQRERLKDLKEQVRSDDRKARATASQSIFYGFPRRDRVLPTRLGNVIRAAEMYGARTYGMNVPLWWPRLWSLLPAEERARVDTALAGLLALLNMGTLAAAIGLGVLVEAAIRLPARALVLGASAAMAGRFLALLYHIALLIARGGLHLLVALACWAFARVCYEGAIVQARAYGERLRVAVDLYRLRVIESMNLRRPRTPRDERAMWDTLTDWVYRGDIRSVWEENVAYTRQAPTSSDGP